MLYKDQWLNVQQFAAQLTIDFIHTLLHPSYEDFVASQKRLKNIICSNMETLMSHISLLLLVVAVL